jgi:hypothetical protein
MTTFEDLPAPGEPLKREIHPQNQALLENEIARRVELARAKLSKRQRNNLIKKYRALQRELNRAGYNRLVSERHELLTEYNNQIKLYRQKPSPKRRALILEMREAGKELDARIRKLQPTLKKWLEIKKRLDIHEQVLQLEQEESENRTAFFAEADAWEAQINSVFRQSPRLHHITRNAKGEESIRTPVIDHILLKADKIYFRIRTSYQGFIDRYMGRWHSALPYGVDITDLVSDVTLANLSGACGRVVTVERSPRSLNLYYVIQRMDYADSLPKSLRFDQVTDYYPTEKHAATPWAAGSAEEKKIAHFDFEQYPNVLIAGSAGGGKSNLINAMISQLITMNSPDELRLILIDNKGGVELSHFEGIPHLLTPPVISVENVIPSLKTIVDIMKQRLEAFRKIGARKLLTYNERVKNPIPRLIVVIDEMASLLGLDDTPEIHSLLRLISSQGRAAGIHLIVSTQHPSVDVLPGWIKTNLTLRIASRMPNHTASQIIVDSITAAHLPEIAGRMVFRRGGFEQILQTPLIEDIGIEKAVKIACGYGVAEWQIIEPDKSEDDTDEYTPIVGVPIFGRDEYLQAAIELDGSLSPRKIFDHIGKKYLTQTEVRKFGDELIETLLEEKQVTIGGVVYEIEKLKRGYRLKLLGELLEKTPLDQAVRN